MFKYSIKKAAISIAATVACLIGMTGIARALTLVEATPLFAMVDASIGTTNGLIGTTNTLLGTTNEQLQLIYKGLTGSNPLVNIHNDINEVNGSVNNGTKVVSTAIDMLGKKTDFYAKRAIYAKSEMLNTPQVKESNCQAAISSNAMQQSGQGKGGSPTIAANKAALSTFEESRRKTMRNQIADITESIDQHATNFCSESDAIAGLCKAADVCKDGDQSCKASADQDAGLFIVDGYESQAHQDGAVQFIKHLTDPYPTEKPKASTVKNMADSSSYKYDNIVHESKSSVARSLFNELWADRSNIITDQATKDMLESVSAYDAQTRDRAKKYLNINYIPANYKPYFMNLSALNPVYKLVATAVKPIPNVAKGAISRMQMLDLQVNSMYGNRAWVAMLHSGDGEGRVALGRSMSLQNKLTLILIRRMDRLIMAQATILALKTSNSSTVSSSGMDGAMQ